MPDTFLRLAGGRVALKDVGQKAFLSGINAVITGDMLTTSVIAIDSDMQNIKDSGYIVEFING